MPPPPARTDGNEKQIAVIQQWMKSIDEKLDKMDVTLNKVNDCIGNLNIQANLNKAKLGSHDADLNRMNNDIKAVHEKVDDLAIKSGRGDVATSIFSGIALIIGSVFGSKP